MKDDIQSVAINTGINAHILDHIAALAFILDIPLIVTEEKNYYFSSRYYPQVNVQLYSNAELTARTTRDYNIFFQSTFWSPREKFFYSFLRKDPILFAHCPHGNSDKGYLKPMMQAIRSQDLVLINGDHMKDRMIEQQYWNQVARHVIIGNIRKVYYMRYRSFYDAIVQKEVFSFFSNANPTILYAPTWNDMEGSSSFFSSIKYLIEQVPVNYNLIIKPHPLLKELETANYYAALAKADKKKNILVLEDFPLIYPLLAHIDIYIGDYSSIGYDFLAFQKPMFFFSLFQNTHPKRLSLHNCGWSLTQKNMKRIFDFIENNLSSKYQERQKQIYHYAYGEKNLSVSSIKKKINQHYKDFIKEKSNF